MRLTKKTADNLFDLMLEVLGRLQSEWKVTVVAFTTDASGESRKARKLLLARFPHLVCPDCFAHQVNLIVGDYFKAESIYVKHSKMASDLISWLCSKTYILARLREVQTQSGKPPLTVICAVLTRWTAHYLAFKRLLIGMPWSGPDWGSDPNCTGPHPSHYRHVVIIAAIASLLMWSRLGVVVFVRRFVVASSLTRSSFHRDQCCRVVIAVVLAVVVVAGVVASSLRLRSQAVGVVIVATLVLNHCSRLCHRLVVDVVAVVVGRHLVLVFASTLPPQQSPTYSPWFVALHRPCLASAECPGGGMAVWVQVGVVPGCVGSSLDEVRIETTKREQENRAASSPVAAKTTLPTTAPANATSSNTVRAPAADAHKTSPTVLSSTSPPKPLPPWSYNHATAISTPVRP
ncbi:hypothetical protein EDB84DRAFT_1567670 [Lactarius hengduanensis]|nr:hypothetical protein EDB84DRAFT_1567670 [Lactarius hengduanensis]